MTTHVEQSGLKELEVFSSSFKVHSGTKICSLCGITFTHGRASNKYCGCCRLISECTDCGGAITSVLRERVIGNKKLASIIALIESGDIDSFSSRCIKCTRVNNGRTTNERHGCVFNRPDIREKNLRSLRDNYYGTEKHIEAGRMGRESQKENGLSFYDNGIQKAIHKYQKEHGIAIYNPEVREKSQKARVEASIESRRAAINCLIGSGSLPSIVTEVKDSINGINTLTEIDYNNSFVPYDSVPGVWAIHGDSGICLDVCETKDIGK